MTNEVQQKGKVQKKFQNKEKSFGSPLVKHREDQKWFEYQVSNIFIFGKFQIVDK